MFSVSLTIVGEDEDPGFGVGRHSIKAFDANLDNAVDKLLSQFASSNALGKRFFDDSRTFRWHKLLQNGVALLAVNLVKGQHAAACDGIIDLPDLPQQLFTPQHNEEGAYRLRHYIKNGEHTIPESSEEADVYVDPHSRICL